MMKGVSAAGLSEACKTTLPASSTMPSLINAFTRSRVMPLAAAIALSIRSPPAAITPVIVE